MEMVSEVESSTQISSDSSTTGLKKPFKVPTPPVEGNGEVVAFIGPGVDFKGEIFYEGTIQIDGQLDGEVHTKGTLLIGETAVVNAQVSAGSVVSKGKLRGDIVATEIVRLLDLAVMDGSLKTPKLWIDLGVTFNGDISMKSGTNLPNSQSELK